MKRLVIAVLAALLLFPTAAQAVMVSMGNVTNGAQNWAGQKTFTSRVSFIVPGDASVEFGSVAGYGYLSGTSAGSILSHGCYFDGTNFIATQTSAAIVNVNPTLTTYSINTGLTPGNSFTPTQVFGVNATGAIIGTGTPSARFNIPAGSTTVSSIQLATGTLLTTPVAGTIEYSSGVFYFTPSSAVREKIYSGPTLVSTTLTPGAISNGSQWESGDIAVPGAAATEPAVVGVPAAFETGLSAWAKVTGTNTVHIIISNNSGGSVTPSAGATYTVTVLH